MGRPIGQDLEVENELLKAQLEAIRDQIGDLLDELEDIERDPIQNGKEPEE